MLRSTRGYSSGRHRNGCPNSTPRTSRTSRMKNRVKPCPAAMCATPGPASQLPQLRILVDQHKRPSDDAGLVTQEAVLAFSYLQQSGALPSSIWDPVDLVSRAFELTDLLATGSTFRTLQMLKRHPALLQLSPEQVAAKVLQLKMLMPAANIADLLYQKPTLLLLDDIPGVCGGALKQLVALMPGIPVERKLHEGGTVFWSFASLLESSSSTAAARAGSSSSSSGRSSPPRGCPSSPDARMQRQQW